MNSFFLDASALVKRYALEKGTPLVNHLFSRVTLDRFFLLNVGMAEVVSILVRKKNSGFLTPVEFGLAMSNFSGEVVQAPNLQAIAVGQSLVAPAFPFIEKYSLNGTDGIMLHAALRIAVQLRPAGNNLVMTSSDLRLLKASQAEGLLVFNPETQTQAELDVLINS